MIKTEKLLRIYCKKDNIVYDPFIGIGTTAKACKKLGMKYIGSEIYEEYYKLAVKSVN